MTKDDINKYAYADQMPEEPLNCAERCLFYALRDTYRSYKSGRISREQGEKEKGAAIRQFDRDNGELDSARKILYSHADLWMSIEQAANRYRKEPTIANADAFIEAVYNVKMKQNMNA